MQISRHSAGTLFAFQILLGVVFGIWELALALPPMTIAKFMIDHFKSGLPPAETAQPDLQAR